MVIVRVIAFWYQIQPMCIKWDKANSVLFWACLPPKKKKILRAPMALWESELQHYKTIFVGGFICRFLHVYKAALCTIQCPSYM